MKTEKTIYTCDRCGKELKKNFLDSGPGRFRKAITATKFEFERYAYLDEAELAEKLEILPETEDTIVFEAVCGFGATRIGRMDLCKKCSKAFKSFMQMGAKKE